MLRKNQLSFWEVDRDGAAIYLHYANMETKANNKIATKPQSSTESVKDGTKAEKSRSGDRNILPLLLLP